MKYKAPRGTRDILPEESWKWQRVEEVFRETAARFGYREIRTPAFEETELFARRDRRLHRHRPQGDVHVRGQKGQEPHAPPRGDRGRRARVRRAQHGARRPRHEALLLLPDVPIRAAAGRAVPPVLAVGARVSRLALARRGRRDHPPLRDPLRGARHPRHRGAREQRRLPEVHARLQRDPPRETLAARLPSFCDDCRVRFERNPRRMFDCKNEACLEVLRGAPSILESLCHECREHFDRAQAYLSRMSVPFRVDTSLARGLDYYTKTVFEVHYAGLGAQSALCGGGRYDQLVEELGGGPTPACGVSAGVERLLTALESEGALPGSQPGAGRRRHLDGRSCVARRRVARGGAQGANVGGDGLPGAEPEGAASGGGAARGATLGHRRRGRGSPRRRGGEGHGDGRAGSAPRGSRRRRGRAPARDAVRRAGGPEGWR